MFAKLQAISPTRWVTYGLLAFSIVLLGLTIYMNFNIRVLENWTLTLPDQKIHVGDEIVVKSAYTKLRSVSGEAIRYLDCKDKTGAFLRYELNKRPANRAAKTGGTGIQVILPNVPDVPTQCKISVVITYDVLPWRKVVEINDTKLFTLLPKRTALATSERGAVTGTNQTQELASSPQLPSQSVSSSKNTPSAAPTQSNSSQKTASRPTQSNPSAATPIPEPTLIERILEPVTNIIGGS